jgi:protein O-mannosyl-transferase
MGKKKKRKSRKSQARQPAHSAPDSGMEPQPVPTGSPGRSRVTYWILYGLIALAGILAYSNSYSGVLLFDDEYGIRDNPDLGKWYPLKYPLYGVQGAPSCARPPVQISLTLNHNFGGIDPVGYHIVNLAIHLVTAFFLFALLQNLLRRTERFSEHAIWLAFITTLIWTVHPIHTGCITYISQRAETIMGMFFVMTFYFADRDRKTAAVVCCVLSAMSKEVGAMIPFIYPIYLRAFREATWRAVWAQNKVWILTMFALSWTAVSMLLATGPKGNTVRFELQNINPFTYLMSSTNAIVEYIRLIYWPHPLVLDYGWPIADEWHEYRLGLGIVSSLFLLTIFLVVKFPKWGFIGASCFLILAPTSSVLPIMSEMWAEHRMYLPSFPIITATVLLAYCALQGLDQSTIRISIACVLTSFIVFAFAALTYRQNKLFDTQVTMWQHNATHKPSRRAWYNLGYALDGEHRTLEAIEAYRNSIRWSPDWDKPHRFLGSALMSLDRYEEAAAHLQAAIKYEPQEMDNYLFMGQLQYMVNNPDLGANMFATAQKLSPSHPNVHKAMAFGRLYHDDVMGALPHLLVWLGQKEVNERVVKEAIVFALALKREKLALHIEAMGLQTGHLKERVLSVVNQVPPGAAHAPATTPAPPTAP